MSLLDANADSLRAAAVNAQARPVGPTPAPGMFQNFAPGAGNYFMRSLAEVGRAGSLALGAVPVIADKLIGDDNKGESFADRYFRMHDDVFGSAVDYWTPKPQEVGAAGQVVGSLAGGLVQFFANPALLVATSQLSTAEDLVRQGVDPGAALVAGDVAGLATVAGIGIPIFGKSLGQRLAAGAVGNLATSMPEAAIKRAVVNAAGSPEAAQQFDPWDMRARVVDVLMGAAFGWKAHLDVRAAQREAAFLDGPIPSQRTPIADAAAQTIDAGFSASQRDAIMVMNAARHMEEAATPGRPMGEQELTAAVDSVRTAIDQMLRGEPVSVPARQMPASESVGLSGAPIKQEFRDTMREVYDSELPPAQPKIVAPDAAPRTKAPAKTGEPAADAQAYPDTLRIPTGEFDPATGLERTITANEHVAATRAEADRVKATAQGLMETAATCLMGGI